MLSFVMLNGVKLSFAMLIVVAPLLAMLPKYGKSIET
jgi:hypothetical protein